MVDHNKTLINAKYFQIPNWKEYQHYGKHRNPPWIKLHNKILSDYRFNKLSEETRLHILMLWLLASKTDNKLTNDPEWLKSEINAKNDIDLEAIVGAGFLETYNGMQTLAERLREAP